MKLKNVYYGFTKEGQRKLLWKRYKVEMTSFGDIKRTIYYDLEKKAYVEPYDVDEKTLVSIVQLVGNYKRKSKRKVINAYKADCNLLYDVKGAFYGNIVNKTTIYDLESANGYYMGSGRNDLYDDAFVMEMENVLFARISDPDGRVQSLKSGGLYSWADKVKKGISVQEVRPIRKDLFSKTVVTKKKLLEADYKKKL